ncbi:MAG TPA: response regulator transcription factor [Fimbriimonadaceae bacterium]|nr:response regulator transcription factor [Fimbriimonadaceae bacterium]
MTPKIRLVIAEDEPVFRNALKKTLSLADDCEIIAVCEDGQEALETCLKTPPDVLLTDITMPRMDGLELMRSLLRKVKTITPVVLTTHEDDESIFEAFQVGAVGYLLKTSTPNDVLEAVRLAVRGEAKITPKIAARLITDFRRADENPELDQLTALSERENEVLELVAKGKRNREIANDLGITEKTVKNHVSNILRVMQANTRTEAAMIVARARQNES